MRKLAACAISLLALGTVAMAQDEADLAKWMKATNAEMGAIRKADPKTGPDVAASADKIAVVYDQSKGFWEKRNVPDAVQWTEEGKEAAMTMSAAAKANDSEKVMASMKILGGTCKSCHDAHREKLADGTYKIK